MRAARSAAVFAVLALSAGCSLWRRSPPPTASAPTRPGAPVVASGELDPRTLLGDLPTRAARLGAGVPSMVTADEATENDWVGGFVEVPRDDCLLGYARAASTIDDVDLSVYADDGAQLAADEGRDVHPTLLLCPPHPDRVYVAAHVALGEGFVVVAAQLVPKDRAVIVARALGARGGIEEGPRVAESWPGLEDAVHLHRREIGGTWEEFKRVALSVDPRAPTYVSLPIEAEGCIDAVVVPDDDVAMLDVEAVDGDGRVVARAREGAGVRTVTLCSPTSMPGTLGVRPHSGHGLAAVVLARARGDAARDLGTQPDIVWASATQPLEAAKHARDTLLAKSGYDAPVASTTGSLLLGRRVAVPLDLKAMGTGCARVDVVAGAPLGLVEARVWDDAGQLLAHEEASTSVALFACAHGSARLELETHGRPGPFAVTVRPERWRDPVFAAHALAASRMIARAAAGPDRLLEGRQAAVRAATLDAAHSLSWTRPVDPGKCVRVTVGVEGEGAGVDLRAADATDDSELDRGHAAFATTVRACAPNDSPRTVRFEARASAGKVDAVIGEQSQ